MLGKGVFFVTIKEGELAPDFTLPNQHGDQVSLSDFKGKKVVLYFYPKDMTPGCTTQACDFRDSYQGFTDSDTIILGVSPDPIERHQKFIDKHELPFDLLADVDKEVAQLYGVWQLKKNFGREYYGVVRSTFIINEEGIIDKAFRNVRVRGHVEEMLSYVQE